MASTPMLTDRQRTAPPINRWEARRLEASGGKADAQPRTIANGIVDTISRFPGTVFDRLIKRDRGPWYPRPHYSQPADSWVNWTAAGPTRPELAMRNITWRNLVGNSRSRFPVVDTPTTGMHTMGPAGVEISAGIYQDRRQMTAARPFRLSPGQYSGQTYSQTTQVQGGGSR